MHLNTEVSDADIARMINAFIAITGIEEWDRCLNSLNSKLSQNELLRAYVAEIYALELEFGRVLLELADTGHIDLRTVTVERYRLFAFIAAVASIYERITPKGQRRLKGMIRGGLRTDGLTPLQQEMSVATHLFNRGFDVFFSDIETGSGFDFLATQNGVELEVECKRVGLSLGRKIPRLETLKLHKRILSQVQPVMATLKCGLLLRVFLPTRLTANESEQRAIATAIGAACRTGVTPVTNVCDIELHAFQIAGTPFEDASVHSDVPRVRGFLERQYNIRNREVLVLGHKGRCALAVSIESRQPDSLLESLFSELRDSADKQFSKKRPGVLCVQFLDLTNEQVQRLGSASDNKSPSSILHETSRFLSSPNRSHVHSVVFRGRGDVTQMASFEGDAFTHATQEQGSAFFVTNDTHPLARDRRYAIFGDAARPSRFLV